MPPRFLLAILLASPLAPAAERVPVVPAPFVGEWNARPADCGKRNNDSELHVAPRTIGYHESSGPVKAVVVHGRQEVEITVELSGEGEKWLSTEHFRLSPDGNRLESLAKEGDSLVRYRCPARHR